MPFQTYELDAIKAATAQALATTLVPYRLDEITAREVALAVLEAIDAAAEDPTDPRPFIEGRKVRVRASEMKGVVVRVVEGDGELHTVVVSLVEVPGHHPFSPGELEVIG